MARTSCEIEFEIVDITAKEDGTLAVNGEQSFSDAQSLKKNGVLPPKIATGELNRWLLDGTFSLLDTEAEYGWWSRELCGQNGVFSTPPTLTITFSDDHTTSGLTLDFAGDAWPSKIQIKWFGASGGTLADATFYPDGLTCFCEKQVENFRKLQITFLSMSIPYRYLKMTRILYGQVLTFSGSELTAASIQEEVDPISAEVSINTASFTVRADIDSFNPVNPSGIYRSLQQRQPITIRETVAGVYREMGTYYLNEWDTVDGEGSTFQTVDAIGLLDLLPFSGAQWSNASVPDIAADIFSGCSVPYILAEDYSSMRRSGKLGACTKREALQQLAFSLGAVVETNRSSTVHIVPPDMGSGAMIEKTRKWLGQKLTLRPLVTGVEVTAHSFNSSGTDTKTVVGYYAQSLPANTSPNVLRVTDAYLVSNSEAAAVAKRVYDYYQLRHKMS